MKGVLRLLLEPQHIGPLSYLPSQETSYRCSHYIPTFADRIHRLPQPRPVRGEHNGVGQDGDAQLLVGICQPCFGARLTLHFGSVKIKQRPGGRLWKRTFPAFALLAQLATSWDLRGNWEVIIYARSITGWIGTDWGAFGWVGV